MGAEKEDEVFKDKDGREYVKVYLDMPFGQHVQMNIPGHTAIGVVVAVEIREKHTIRYGVVWGSQQELFHSMVELKRHNDNGTA